MAPIQDGDIIAVKYCQSFFGKDVCMVWTITTENPSGAIDLIDLVRYLRDVMGPLINAVQSDAVENSVISAEVLNRPNDIAQVAWAGQGARGGEVTPRFNAYGIRLNRGSRITRNGYKRVPGVAEADQFNGTVDPGLLNDIRTKLVDLAGALSAGRLINPTGGTVQLQPVIVGRTPTGSYDLTRVQAVLSADVKSAITSQTSRK